MFFGSGFHRKRVLCVKIHVFSNPSAKKNIRTQPVGIVLSIPLGSTPIFNSLARTENRKQSSAFLQQILQSP